ncbi:Acyl-CoA-binding domain protein [Melia azedarach]|uniref:Acyl-CoA-binding domain protein n=1 Tax=Melia azedarach TaxID=155640 RepID=A0ACC1X1I7_MELAZ|nr:Acyl-CoA-binding domain protein [Melia azedarach]
MRGRKPIVVALMVAMVMGIAIYLRLWTIDYTVSSVDTELIRRQFDIANRDAMDEAAEWRRKYDEEFERATKCAVELAEARDSLGKKVDRASNIKQKLAMLQQENAALLERVKVLNQQLESQKLKCGS